MYIFYKVRKQENFTQDLLMIYGNALKNITKIYQIILKVGGPFMLIYYEAYVSKYDAMAREKYLKSGMGKRYMKNRLKRFLSLTGWKYFILSHKQTGAEPKNMF